MSGCSCYEKKAEQARKKIKDLKDERAEYDEVKDEINAFKPQIENYQTFFSNLGGALEAVIISGKNFDDGKCAQTASSLGGIKGKLDDITTEILDAKLKINKEISRQYGIVNDVYYCARCKAKDEQAASSEQIS